MRITHGRWMTALGGLVALGCGGASAPGPVDAPGVLELVVGVTGTPIDSGGYTIVVTVADRGELPPLTLGAIGGTVRVPDLAVGTHHLRVVQDGADCILAERSPIAFSIASGETTRVTLTVTCPAVSAVYRRAVPGSAVERFLFGTDDTFRHQLLGTPPVTFAGTFRRSDDVLDLSYADDPRWSARATVRGGCLAVAYNVTMGLSGFDDGDYCGP